MLNLDNLFVDHDTFGPKVTGYTSQNCRTGETGPIYLWAPGAELQVLPEFLGVKLNGVDGIRCIRVQTHYDNPNLLPNLVDSSGPVLHLSVPNTVRPTELGVIQINDPGVRLGGKNLPIGWSKHLFDCTGLRSLPEITFFSVGHHSKRTTTSPLQYSSYRPNGSTQALMQPLRGEERRVYHSFGVYAVQLYVKGYGLAILQHSLSDHHVLTCYTTRLYASARGWTNDAN